MISYIAAILATAKRLQLLHIKTTLFSSKVLPTVSATMKISTVVVSALLAVQASCAATPRNDDYSQLQALVEQAAEVAKEELAAADSSSDVKRAPPPPGGGPGHCTLDKLSIRREW